VLAVPTPDHYLPLLYVIGARQNREAVAFPVEGVDGGSISMLAVQVADPLPRDHGLQHNARQHPLQHPFKFWLPRIFRFQRLGGARATGTGSKKPVPRIEGLLGSVVKQGFRNFVPRDRADIAPPVAVIAPAQPGEQPINDATRAANDVFRLVESADPRILPYLYLDCGIDDPFLSR